MLITSDGNKTGPGVRGRHFLTRACIFPLLPARWSCWYSTYSTFRTANKTVKIIRNNNLFNEQTQIFICHLKKVFTENVGGSELEHTLLLTSEALVRRWWLAKYQWNLLFQPTTNLLTDMALGNLNLTLLYIVIWGLNPPLKKKIFNFMLK